MTRACHLLHDLLADTATVTPHAIALVCDRERYSYLDLEVRANRIACELVARGVERGDRVIVFADNSVETAIAFWAVLKAGAVVSIVHPQTRTDKLAYLLEDCRARALITHQRLAAVFAPAARRSPHLAAVVVADLAGDARAQLADLPGLASWDELLAAGAASPPPRRCLDIDLAAIIYTSGSTGEPKGVMLTHRTMLAAAGSLLEYLRVRRSDVILCVLPLAFDYGLDQMIQAFATGARLVLERSFAFPTQVMRTVVQERVTGFPGVPTIFATLLGLAARFDLSAVRYVTNTAAALCARGADRARSREGANADGHDHGAWRFGEGYPASERFWVRGLRRDLSAGALCAPLRGKTLRGGILPGDCRQAGSRGSGRADGRFAGVLDRE
jgi:acyl-CoA synthetase (AMP-forming)/AMP-acid ligase II